MLYIGRNVDTLLFFASQARDTCFRTLILCAMPTWQESWHLSECRYHWLSGGCFSSKSPCALVYEKLLALLTFLSG